MIKIVGLTGGIGSGKTTIGKWFFEKGIPVYNSDQEAKNLISNDPRIVESLTELLGAETYQNGMYNSKFVASKVFSDKELLNQLNQIVHPAVFLHFKNWVKQQTTPFVVKEAAILFESGSYKDCDAVISVVADEKVRIQRVTSRDNSNPEQVRQRMANQWKDEQRIEKSDYVIYNNLDLNELRKEFHKVYNKLLKQFQSS